MCIRDRINAGGVTIHSMFGLPLRTFLPTTDRVDSDTANNIADLMHHFRYRKDKIKLLREIEIIIIDEVSMPVSYTHLDVYKRQN